MVLEGIDVSVYQGNIDWATVASQGIYYGFAKATEGASTTDPAFAKNWAGMKSVGLVRGAYHFFGQVKIQPCRLITFADDQKATMNRLICRLF
ncbi:MAG: hypothetical protein HC936_03745 [Leptolyngbyaceae cyanobacterium SU_3_3]|nr:hypothetical protein [Leptolyngbyaceae cyanobacterium SU_3_3]